MSFSHNCLDVLCDIPSTCNISLAHVSRKSDLGYVISRNHDRRNLLLFHFSTKLLFSVVSKLKRPVFLARDLSGLS